MNKVIVLLLILLSSLSLRSQSVRINEFSQGANNEKEWVELVVMASTPVNYTNCFLLKVNLSGWILDDNNGDFSPPNHFTGSGVAAGHIRFKNQLPWTNLSVGAMILIYNAADKDILTNFPADDPFDWVNNDCVYVLPSNHPSLEYCTTLPAATTCTSRTNYSSCTYSTIGGWPTIGLRTDGDAIQVRTPTFNLVHGVVYGKSTSAFGCATAPNMVGTSLAPLITTSTMPTGTFAAFNGTSDADYFNSSSWILGDYLTGTPTPGAFNNTNNQNYIFNTLRGGCSCHRILPLDNNNIFIPKQQDSRFNVTLNNGILKSTHMNLKYRQNVIVYNALGQTVFKESIFVDKGYELNLNKFFVSGFNFIEVVIESKVISKFIFKVVTN